MFLFKRSQDDQILSIFYLVSCFLLLNVSAQIAGHTNALGGPGGLGVPISPPGSPGIAPASTTVVTIVDMTQELHENVPSFFPTGLSRNITLIGDQAADGYSAKIEYITLPTHLGTHMDSPCHFNKSSWCVTDIPLERLVLVPAAVIDIRHKVFVNDSNEPDTQLTIEDLTLWEEKNGRIPDNSLVLALTGWSRFWDNSGNYVKAGHVDTAQNRHPGLSPKAADWLVRERPTIYGVGIDTISIDYGRSRKFESHQYFAANNVYVLENLTNLDRLPATGALINVGAIKLAREASGAPARIIATIYSSK